MAGDLAAGIAHIRADAGLLALRRAHASVLGRLQQTLP